MTAFQSYLLSPKIKRVLHRRPGDKGFSLIELVVVVAVLAILAAVAIPEFSKLSDDARLNTGKNMLIQSYKECEFNKARTGNAAHAEIAATAVTGALFSGKATSADCDGDAIYAIGNPVTCTIEIHLTTGVKDPVAWPASFDDC